MRFLTLLPMTSGQMRFLPSVEMTGVSREKMEGGEAAASPPPHLPPYPQWHGVISTAGRNLVIMNYLFFYGGLGMRNPEGLDAVNLFITGHLFFVPYLILLYFCVFNNPIGI